MIINTDGGLGLVTAINDIQDMVLLLDGQEIGAVSVSVDGDDVVVATFRNDDAEHEITLRSDDGSSTMETLIPHLQLVGVMSKMVFRKRP